MCGSGCVCGAYVHVLARVCVRVLVLVWERV